MCLWMLEVLIVAVVIVEVSDWLLLLGQHPRMSYLLYNILLVINW